MTIIDQFCFRHGRRGGKTPKVQEGPQVLPAGGQVFPQGEEYKADVLHLLPDIEEHWLEVKTNPWEGQGTGPYGSSQVPRVPMVRLYGAGRDSIVANYRMPVCYKSQFQAVVSVHLSLTPQLPPQFQSPAPRSWSQSYSSPPKYAASQSSSVDNQSQFLKPVFSQLSATMVSGEGGNYPEECFSVSP